MGIEPHLCGSCPPKKWGEGGRRRRGRAGWSAPLPPQDRGTGTSETAGEGGQRNPRSTAQRSAGGGPSAEAAGAQIGSLNRAKRASMPDASAAVAVLAASCVPIDAFAEEFTQIKAWTQLLGY